jgi:hypothetical protein
MAAPRNNRFAAKAPEQRHDEILYVRLRKSDKDRIVDAARDVGLASWVRQALLQAAGRDERSEGEQAAPPNAALPRR